MSQCARHWHCCRHGLWQLTRCTMALFYALKSRLLWEWGYSKLVCARGQGKASYNFAFGRIIQTFFAFPLPDTIIHEPFTWACSEEVGGPWIAEVGGKASLTFIKLDLIRKSKSCFIEVSKEDSGPPPGFITLNMCWEMPEKPAVTWRTSSRIGGWRCDRPLHNSWYLPCQMLL